MRTISKFLSTAALAACVSTGFAQANLGAECGCPAPASRPEVNLSTKGVTADYGTPLITGFAIKKNLTLYCDTTYILDSKIYIDSAVTLTIKPGTVIKGLSVTNPAEATALIVQRGATINAAGTETSPIVFTAKADDLNGSIGYDQKGLWGGVVILGRATNNLTMAKNGTPIDSKHYCTGKDGQGYVEGFDRANPRNLYGGNDDNDNSGVLRYVSIRHSGAILAIGNELNGLSLGSVGRGTTIDHIELICSNDDGIEFFGGTVNVDHIAAMFGNDDMFDYDLGYRGKMQFLFGIDAPDAIATMNDNGFEADNDDNNSNNAPYTTATICNATMIGNNTSVWVNDQSGSAGFMAKENTRGSVYNSLFINYVYGLCLATKNAGTDGYNQWTAGEFKFKNNSFIGVKNALVTFNGKTSTAADFDASKTVATAADSTTLFANANNRIATPAGLDYTYAAGTSDKFDVVPTNNVGNTISGVCPVAASFRGAFEAGKPSWLSKWSYASVLNVSTGMVTCDTDNNGDGKTDSDDFLKLLGQYNQSCN